MKSIDPGVVTDRLFSTAGEAIDAGLFWRGNLAKAVKRKDFKGTLAGVLVLSLLLFFYVWQHMQVVKLGYEVQSLKTEEQQLTNEYYYLRYKMYDVGSLARVEGIARQQLGMVTPQSNQVVILGERSVFAPLWFSYWADASRGGRK